MELLKHARKGEKWGMEGFASGMPSITSFSPDEILNLMDDNDKHNKCT